mmetsp:Transcript_87534/g.169593  ORF Transcript_87534/g.169593 Transcript_87534/m.169593 type:complete len:208 (-) Transcript_87534:490-1113(-)
MGDPRASMSMSSSPELVSSLLNGILTFPAPALPLNFARAKYPAQARAITRTGISTPRSTAEPDAEFTSPPPLWLPWLWSRSASSSSTGAGTATLDGVGCRDGEWVTGTRAEDWAAMDAGSTEVPLEVVDTTASAKDGSAREVAICDATSAPPPPPSLARTADCKTVTLKVANQLTASNCLLPAPIDKAMSRTLAVAPNSERMLASIA